MKANDSMVKIGGFALLIAIFLGAGMVSTAAAQSRYDDRYGYNRNNDQVRWTRDHLRQYAFVLGYHNAYSEGRDARNSGFRPDFRNSDSYRNDNNGYLVWMGNENDYRSRYREGARDGFNDGLNGRARRYDRDDVERLLGGNMKDVYENDRYDDRWGRDNDRWGRGNDRSNRQEVYRIAQQNAFNDGLRRGQDDRRRNRSYNYSDDSEYRDALRGYRNEYGDRNVYRQGYRDGFQRGYDQGYRNSNSNGRWPWNR